MSLYLEAASVISESLEHNDSIKHIVFSRSQTFRSPPSQLYALLSETYRCNSLLSEIIENATLLIHERKLTPPLSLLLVHDLLFAKKGIAAPAVHPLRTAVERHQARIRAELTKIRIKRGFSSVESLRNSLNGSNIDHKKCEQKQARWVRVNTLKTTLEEQLRTTFAHFRKVQTLNTILEASDQDVPDAVLYVDTNVPNLLALPVATNVVQWPEYLKGALILQDKASCFPAYLLDPKPEDYLIDACAAPGNKTSHLSAIVSHGSTGRGPRIWACERDKARAQVLHKMLKLSGADDFVAVRAGQDFLQLDPLRSKPDDKWVEATCLLLDPSCSGSGIIGRGDTVTWKLPRSSTGTRPLKASRKRKREASSAAVVHPVEENNMRMRRDDPAFKTRLESLAAFQLRLILHAFTFPHARRITYSTCSLYEEENEHVVLAALGSPEAKARGWEILLREDQVAGMQSWELRGNQVGMGSNLDVKQIADACIRCSKSGEDATQGFFVAAFVRNEEKAVSTRGDWHEDGWNEAEWAGFSDGSTT